MICTQKILQPNLGVGGNKTIIEIDGLEQGSPANPLFSKRHMEDRASKTWVPKLERL